MAKKSIDKLLSALTPLEKAWAWVGDLYVLGKVMSPNDIGRPADYTYMYNYLFRSMLEKRRAAATRICKVIDEENFGYIVSNIDKDIQSVSELPYIAVPKASSDSLRAAEYVSSDTDDSISQVVTVPDFETCVIYLITVIKASGLTFRTSRRNNTVAEIKDFLSTQFGLALKQAGLFIDDAGRLTESYNHNRSFKNLQANKNIDSTLDSFWEGVNSD